MNDHQNPLFEMALQRLGDIEGPSSLKEMRALREHSPRLADDMSLMAFGQVYQDLALDRQTACLCALAMLMVDGRAEAYLEKQVRVALEIGVDPAQIKQLVRQAAVLGGWPQALASNAIVMRVFEAHQIPTETPLIFDDLPTRLQRGEQKLQPIEQGSPGAMDRAFARVGQVMPERIIGLVYGHILSTGPLSDHTRQIITVSMLVALGQQNQLRLHLNGALVMGWRVEELESVMALATVYVGFPRGVDGFLVLSALLDEA